MSSFFRWGIVILALIRCGESAFPGDPTIKNLGKRGMILEKIRNNEWICVINADQGKAWYLILGAYEKNIDLGRDFGALPVIERILVSPDKKFAAVYSSGEGHPFIEIVEVKALRQKQYKVVAEADPYPGVAWPLQWKASRLILASDMILSMPKNREGRVDPGLELPKTMKFALDPLSGRITPFDFDLKKAQRMFFAQLFGQDPSQRGTAILALKALKMKSSIPQLKKALKKERDPNIAHDIQDAIAALTAK
jgi:hypothetical protein